MINYISKPLVNEIIVNYMLEYDDENYNYDVISALRTVSEKINEVIPADVQPVKRGRWVTVRVDGDSETICNNCYDNTIMRTDFCPHCGADMRGHEAIKG